MLAQDENAHHVAKQIVEKIALGETNNAVAHIKRAAELLHEFIDSDADGEKELDWTLLRTVFACLLIARRSLDGGEIQ
jgi:hypothetical protein